MAETVVDDLEAVDVQVQQREASLAIATNTGDGALDTVAQVKPVGQASQRVVHHLVLQLRFDLLAHRDLFAQLARALFDALLQADIGKAQRFGSATALDAAGELIGDEGQQFGVALVVTHLRDVALHRDHAQRCVAADQGHAEPAGGRRIDVTRVYLTGSHQRARRFRTVHQLRATAAQRVFGEPAPERARRCVRSLPVDPVGEFQRHAVLGQQRDVEVVGVEQFRHRGMNVSEETIAAFVGPGQGGNLVKGFLEVLAALAFGGLASTLQAACQLGGDEAEQLRVSCVVGVVVEIALYRQHAYRPLSDQQRHTQPETRELADIVEINFTGGGKLCCARWSDQLCLPGLQHIFGQPPRQGPRRPVRLVGVLHIGERHGQVVFRQQRNIEILHVQQLGDDAVNLRIEALASLFADREGRNLVQGRLQALAALPFDDLLAQFLVGFGQLAGTFLDAPFEFLLALLAFQRGQDVLGDEAQQRHIRAGETDVRKIALHHDHAPHLALSQHRHAEPVVAVGTVDVQWPGDLRLQLRVGPHQRLALTDHPPGRAVLDAVEREVGIGGQILVIHAVDEIQEADAVRDRIVQRDVEILGVHEFADNAVQPAQHVRHVEVGPHHVGNREQRALELLGLRQLRHRVVQTLDRQHFAHACAGSLQGCGRRRHDRLRRVQDRDCALLVAQHLRMRRRRSAFARGLHRGSCGGEHAGLQGR